MKNKYILFALLLCSFNLFAQDNRFRIDGTADVRYNDSLVTLFTFLGSTIRSVDSTYVKNGRFHFEGPEYMYEKSIVSIGNYPDTVLCAELFLIKGDIEIEMKPKSIVRSSLVAEHQAFKDSCDVFLKKLRADTTARKEKLQAFYAYQLEFKKKHIHNGFGRELLVEEYNTYGAPHFEELYNMLPDRDKRRVDVKSYYEPWARKQKHESYRGKPFIDFTLVDSLGEQKRISEYVGKHELLFLDFWASWCGPCLAQEPELVKLHQAYKDRGFEILGISLDVNRKSWLSALKRKEIVWPELCVANREGDKQIRELYSILGIPFGALIDKSGKIITLGGHWMLLKMCLEEYYREQ